MKFQRSPPKAFWRIQPLGKLFSFSHFSKIHVFFSSFSRKDKKTHFLHPEKKPW
jgi:hypothetical protein